MSAAKKIEAVAMDYNNPETCKSVTKECYDWMGVSAVIVEHMRRVPDGDLRARFAVIQISKIGYSVRLDKQACSFAIWILEEIGTADKHSLRYGVLLNLLACPRFSNKDITLHEFKHLVRCLGRQQFAIKALSQIYTPHTIEHQLQLTSAAAASVLALMKDDHWRFQMLLHWFKQPTTYDSVFGAFHAADWFAKSMTIMSNGEIVRKMYSASIRLCNPDDQVYKDALAVYEAAFPPPAQTHPEHPKWIPFTKQSWCEVEGYLRSSTQDMSTDEERFEFLKFQIPHFAQWLDCEDYSRGKFVSDVMFSVCKCDKNKYELRFAVLRELLDRVSCLHPSKLDIDDATWMMRMVGGRARAIDALVIIYPHWQTDPKRFMGAYMGQAFLWAMKDDAARFELLMFWARHPETYGSLITEFDPQNGMARTMQEQEDQKVVIAARWQLTFGVTPYSTFDAAYKTFEEARDRLQAHPVSPKKRRREKMREYEEEEERQPAAKRQCIYEYTLQLLFEDNTMDLETQLKVTSQVWTNMGQMHDPGLGQPKFMLPMAETIYDSDIIDRIRSIQAHDFLPSKNEQFDDFSPSESTEQLRRLFAERISDVLLDVSMQCGLRKPVEAKMSIEQDGGRSFVNLPLSPHRV